MYFLKDWCFEQIEHSQINYLYAINDVSFSRELYCVLHLCEYLVVHNVILFLCFLPIFHYNTTSPYERLISDVFTIISPHNRIQYLSANISIAFRICPFDIRTIS